MITLGKLASAVVLVSAASVLACSDIDPLGPEPTLALQVSEAGGHQKLKALPFHGSTTGRMVGMELPPNRCPAHLPLLFKYEGQGNATHLGRFTVQGSECVFQNPQNPMDMGTGESQFTFTAANGDELHVGYDQTTLTFEAPPSPWLLWSAPIYATGGTGRFQGAELTDVTWSGGAHLGTMETYSTFDGWIRYDASDRSGG